MGTLFKPLDYAAIIGQPHNIPDKSIEKVPSFCGNDVITAKSHLLDFTQCYNKWCHNVNHEDVKMRLFSLSLEADAFEWFTSLDDDGIKTFQDFETAFNKRWGDKKDKRHLLAALTNNKKKENETIEEFNKKFRDMVGRCLADINHQIPQFSYITQKHSREK